MAQGTHEALPWAEGFYASLYNPQSEETVA